MIQISVYKISYQMWEYIIFLVHVNQMQMEPLPFSYLVPLLVKLTCGRTLGKTLCQFKPHLWRVTY